MTAKGKKQNPLTIELRRKANLGKKRSPETCDKLSNELKRRWDEGVYDDVVFKKKKV